VSDITGISKRQFMLAGASTAVSSTVFKNTDMAHAGLQSYNISGAEILEVIL
jgi:hypothetical protein